MAVTVDRGVDFVWPTPVAAYVHVPFCRHRCGYCNFSVVADRDDLIDRYLSAIDHELSQLDRPSIQTIFIGGGTPTHLDQEQLSRLLDIVRARLDFAPDAEFSVEANPEDITADKLACLIAHGVNRISLGVQSFRGEKLSLLQRGHSGDAAADAIRLAASMIPNVSLDLIFATPGETPAQWQADVATALSLPIVHLSTYALTFEKGTEFWSRRINGDLSPADESDEVTMYQAARSMAAQAGLQHYEVSNFAKPGHRCRHNLAYWDGRGWYAAGPGAARFVDGVRSVNHRSTTTYLKRIALHQPPSAESEPISVEQYARERAAFGVRLIDGVDIAAIETETGVDLQTLCAAPIDRCSADALITIDCGRVRLTQRGVLFADTVAACFLG
jgi:oxygen-independent coproporphyrinogen III oxidase